MDLMKTTPLIDPPPRKQQEGFCVTNAKFSSSGRDLNLVDLKLDNAADGRAAFIANPAICFIDFCRLVIDLKQLMKRYTCQ